MILRKIIRYLSELKDITFDTGTPVDDSLFHYDSDEGKWKANWLRSVDGTLAGNSDLNIPTEKAVKTYVDTQVAFVDTLSELNDVDFDTGDPSDDDILRYDSGVSKWKAENFPISFLNNETIRIGTDAGASITTANNCILLGKESGYSVEDGANIVSIGWRAGYSQITNASNLYLGTYAGFKHKASSSLFLGDYAGFNNVDGELDVFIGYKAGYNELGSNKLYIENSDSATPLIYGEFDNNLIVINGKIKITDVLELASGTTVNELSIDGTLGGNSDDALPTEKAVKTYVDEGLLDYTLREEWKQNGFENRTDSELIWIDTSPDRTLSIQPTVTAGFDYWIEGIKYTSAGDTKQITDVEGIHIIYYDGDTLTSIANPTNTQIISIIKTKALVSIIYWSAEDSEAIYIGEERHGKGMSPETHSYLHFTEGLKYLSGLGLNTIDTDQNGSDNAHSQFGIDIGKITDEDLALDISEIISTTGLPIYYMTGATPNWHKEINAGYSVIKTGTTGEDRLAYNEYTGGAWQLTEVNNLQFVLCHIFATTEKDTSMIAILGQASYNTKNKAQTGALTEIHELVLNDILFPEIRPIATVIFQTRDNYSNVMKARIVSTEEGDDYIDWRSEVISRVEISTSDHNSLTGKQGGTADEYYHLTSAEYTELNQWLDNVILGSDGKITLPSGVAINEFSDDGTLGGNSDLAVPTEKAIKTYIDGQNHYSSLDFDTDFASKNIEELNDVDFESGTPIDRHSLIYDASTGIEKWIAGFVSYDDLTDTPSLSQLHDRLHDIDDTNDHNGVDGAVEDNFISFDANGLPQDSGFSDEDFGGISEDDVDDFTIKYENSKLKIADRIEQNIFLNAFLISINGSLTEHDMIDGVRDVYNDESGIDTVESSGQIYDADGDFYEPDLLEILEIDYCEYTNDNDAQTAWETSDPGGGGYTVDQCIGGTPTASSEYDGNYPASKAFDDIGGDECWISSSAPTGGSPQWLKYDFGSSNEKIIVKYRLLTRGDGAGIQSPRDWTFQGSNNDSDWDTLDIQTDEADPGTNTWFSDYIFSNSTAYRYYRIHITDRNGGTSWVAIAEMEMMEILSYNLKVYSEDTIKEQGSYSLKIVADQTESLNDYVRLTFGTGNNKDLSPYNTIKFDIRASRIGTNFRLRIHDTGGTTITKDVTIDTGEVDTWKTINWDICEETGINLDDIDWIDLYILNADEENIIYLDNIYAYSYDSDLIAYYKMDDNLATTTVIDEIGAHNGTLNGGDNTEDLSTEGHDGLALDFNGLDDYISVSDDAELDFGTGEFSISCWIDTDTDLTDVIGDIINKFDKANKVGFNLNIKNNTYNQRQLSFGMDNNHSDNTWTAKAGKLGDESYIYSLTIYNGKLYGGTYPNGKLYEWNGTSAWVEVAGKLGDEIYIFSLAVYNGKLYGSTGEHGKLYEWNGTDAWVEVAPQLGAVTRIYPLTVYNGKLYGGTNVTGSLYEWNGTDAWVEVAPQLGDETYIYSLAVYNGKLYGGTNVNGKLYEWNGTDAWVEVAGKLGTEAYIYSLAVYNGKLYGGTGLFGKLYEWNGTSAWVEVAPQLGAESRIYSLTVYNGKLYGGTANNGKLYEWNGTDAWVEVAGKLGNGSRMWSSVVYDGKFYEGTALNGSLYEWKTGKVATYDYELNSGKQHIVAVKNNTSKTLKLYVNAVLVAESDTFTIADYDLDNAEDLLIGFGIQDYFKGKIDEVKIYNKALTQEEITALYNPEDITNMTLISETFIAVTDPENARIVLWEEDVDAVTIGTDIKAYISKDDGSTWAEVTLTNEGTVESPKKILSGIVDLTETGIGSGTDIRYKIQTFNNKHLKAHATGLAWS